MKNVKANEECENQRRMGLPMKNRKADEEMGKPIKNEKADEEQESPRRTKKPTKKGKANKERESC